MTVGRGFSPPLAHSSDIGGLKPRPTQSYWYILEVSK